MTKHIEFNEPGQKPKLSSSVLFNLFLTTEDSQVIIQPSDLIILPVIEKATILSGQKSKAEKTRKNKEEKKAERRRDGVREQREGKARSAGCPTTDCWTCSLLARYLIITGPNSEALPPESCGISRLLPQ